ncbi:MAG: hypothetical protein JKX80_00800 [Candidatus Pacebacteria bacterium]|nr:hypothetical protein [Candidatus Paceibacterota bacterium]
MKKISMKLKKVHIIVDMDNTLLSMECLNAVIETALSAQLHPDAIAKAMEKIHAEMDKGMDGRSKLSETIPARLSMAKQLGAPVALKHFEIVSKIVPNTLTQGIVTALRDACAVQPEHAISLSIVSGGPQICVDAAVKELKLQLHADNGTQIAVSGIGSKILLTEDGDLDQIHSRIQDSKINAVKEIVNNPARAVMLGDGSMDIEVYDAGIVNYFIAVGLWVRRPLLFDRADNLPYYIKADQKEILSSSLHTVLHAIQS